MTEQAQQLQRVTLAIGEAVECFVQTHRVWHAADLRAFVIANFGEVAPGSPDRVLRQLRLRGRIDYQVVSRRDSLYESLRHEHQLELSV